MLGAAAEMPFAGVWWQVRHYLEGLRRLGHDVHYVEDSDNWPYDPWLETVSEDASGAARRLSQLMEEAGFGDRWAFVNAAREGEVWGMSPERLKEVMAGAEVIINLSGVTVLGEQHLHVPVRIYLETDPVTPQIEIANGNEDTIAYLAAHTHLFTFGERIGSSGCTIPDAGFEYHPTRQPVVIDLWPAPEWFPNPPPGGIAFTTIANWEQKHKDIEYGGTTYTWSKSAEFLKLLEVPRMAGVDVRLALAISDEEAVGLLEAAGFEVVPAAPLSNDPEAYRVFITGSGGEFSAAKDQNVRLRSGWFSDRTATYLASGRPAVVQDTGFEDVLPTGEGLISFRTPEEAAAGLAAVTGDYERHSRAARDIAAEHFRAETVLGRMLSDAGVR